LDTGHVTGPTSEVVEFIETMGSSLKHMHISDKIGNKAHFALGRGEFDWKAIFDSLEKNNYKGLMTLEVISPDQFEQSLYFLGTLQ
jgi:sugar phosphate isomerase/epimerase